MGVTVWCRLRAPSPRRCTMEIEPPRKRTGADSPPILQRNLTTFAIDEWLGQIRETGTCFAGSVLAHRLQRLARAPLLTVGDPGPRGA